MLIRSSLVMVVALAACGDDGGAAVDAPLGQSDAAMDAGLDADPAIASLVGNWVKAPESDPSQMIPMATFRANGTVRLGDATSGDEGTFTVPTPGRVKMVFAHTLETDYVVTTDHLMLTAYLPQGATTGLVGTWKNTTIQDLTITSTTTIAVRADHTATYTLMGPSGSQDWVGTWVAEGTGLVFTATAPTAMTLHVRPLGTQAIGYLLFVKA